MFKDIEILDDLGLIKCTLAKRDPLRFFTRAWIAGAYLGTTAILSYTLAALSQNNPAVAKSLFAGTFGTGLAAIVFLDGELFTSNCIGIATICFLFIKSGAVNTSLTPYLTSSLTSKLSFHTGELFIKGILCNFIVCIGAYCGIKIKDETSKLLLMILFVMAFVLPGFEHCIANAGTFTLGLTLLGNQIS